MTDRVATRRHKAERAGLEARRDGRTRYSKGNEKRQGICPATNPGFSWRRLIIATWRPNWIHSNAATPPPHLDKHDGQKTPRGNAQEDNNDKREFQCLHHETVNLCGAHLVLPGNSINRFPIKRYGANNCNESEVKEEQQKTRNPAQGFLPRVIIQGDCLFRSKTMRRIAKPLSIRPESHQWLNKTVSECAPGK